jgi:predicted PolB exonuclease-like 3'-5' exonuclease
MDTYSPGQLKQFEHDGLSPLFFDIETTGLLDSSDSRLTMVGFMDERGVKQFFQYDSSDEELILAEAFDFFEARQHSHFLVSYNGKYFDIPFLNKRSKLYGRRDFPELPHMDLHEIACGCMNNNRYMAKDYCLRTLLPMYFRNTSGFRCAQVMKLPKEKLYNYEKYELIYHNSLDLYQTALIFEEFKRYDWL